MAAAIRLRFECGCGDKRDGAAAEVVAHLVSCPVAHAAHAASVRSSRRADRERRARREEECRQRVAVWMQPLRTVAWPAYGGSKWKSVLERQSQGPFREWLLSAVGLGRWEHERVRFGLDDVPETELSVLTVRTPDGRVQRAEVDVMELLGRYMVAAAAEPAA